MKLKEGKKYIFKLEGLVELPDGKLYHRLSDPNNVRHLLPAEPYTRYNLENLDEIICQVDKINCSGKIFLEPAHPFYKKGDRYQFQIAGFENIINSDGITEKEILVSDKLGNMVNVPAYWFPDAKRIGMKIWCRIARIKKGNLILVPLSNPDHTQKLNPGTEINLTKIETTTLSGDVEFFVFKDDKDKSYYLRKKYYKEYEIKKGQAVRCRAIRHNEDVFVEPEHPHYLPGETYNFKVLFEDIIEDYPEKEVPVVVVSDLYGKKYNIRKDSLKHFKSGIESLNCLVKEILKGRLVLECNLLL